MTEILDEDNIHFYNIKRESQEVIYFSLTQCEQYCSQKIKKKKIKSKFRLFLTLSLFRISSIIIKCIIYMNKSSHVYYFIIIEQDMSIQTSLFLQDPLVKDNENVLPLQVPRNVINFRISRV